MNYVIFCEKVKNFIKNVRPYGVKMVKKWPYKTQSGRTKMAVFLKSGRTKFEFGRTKTAMFEGFFTHFSQFTHFSHNFHKAKNTKI